MHISRRRLLSAGVGAPCAAAITASAIAKQSVRCPAEPDVAWKRDFEGRRIADLGNDTFLNPVLSGDHPDPTILKDGDNYFATFSSFDATPGLVIWHSKDLLSWVPLSAALPEPLGIVFASDFVKHAGRYYLYIPFIPAAWSKQLPPTSSIWVIHTDDVRGTWSKPIDLGLRGFIDPGHVVAEDGRRYLYLSGGARVRLTDDGLKTDGAAEHSYDGWKYPDSWITEAFSLEGPKLFRRGDFFYLVSAVGGTSGPATGHMVIAARSRSALGPWENCPHNPIVRTVHVEERWWSRGHATVLEGPGGKYWMVYHGYENGFRSLGRQVLLEPLRWDESDWFHAEGGDLSKPISAPLLGSRRTSMPAWSDTFAIPSFGTRWNFFAAGPSEYERVTFEDHSLLIRCKGTDPATCSPLLAMSGDLAYEFSVSIELLGRSQAALCLFFNQRLFLGMSVDGGQMVTYQGGVRSYWQEPAPKKRALHLKIVNDRQIVTFLYSQDGSNWTRHAVRSEVSGYHANTMSDLQSLRPALCAIGDGAVRFRDYAYRGLP